MTHLDSYLLGWNGKNLLLSLPDLLDFFLPSPYFNLEFFWQILMWHRIHIVRQARIAGKPQITRISFQLNAYKGFNWTHFRISLHIFDNIRTSDVPWITLILCSAPYCIVSFLQWGANFIKYVQRNPEVSSIKSFVGIQLKRNC